MERHNLILVTGGSRSGKSKFAEELLNEQEEVLYIATAIKTDLEMEDRIKKHIERRKKSWQTFEGYKNLDEVIEKSNAQYVLLDCITIMVTNLLFEKERSFDSITLEDIESILNEIKNEFKKLILKAKELNKTVIMVTNEIGSGIVPEYKISRVFRDIAGIINQFIAGCCDEVYLIVCGLSLKLK